MHLRLLIILLVLCHTVSGCASGSKGNHVRVVRSGDSYALTVNGEEMYIQGAGLGQAFGRRGENYLRLAAELGANCVRTWGTDQGSRRYLDEAARQGLYVNAGIWLNYVAEDGKFSYLHDQDYMQKKEKETLDYVRRYRSHPAILMWNLGNEAIHFTKSEAERAALCRFLENLILKVKQIDPDHPVIYASASTTALPYLKEHVPSLDAVGMNIYGSVIVAEGRWKALGFKIPYLLTEFGPSGPWDMPKDRNGKVIEASDYAKAAQYRNLWNLTRERKGNNIGGFVFHVGETTQDSLTYWNLNDHNLAKESFRVMQKLFRGLPKVNHAPRILSFKGVPPRAAAGGTLLLEVDAADPENDPMTYHFTASSSQEGVLRYYVNEEVLLPAEDDGPKTLVHLPDQKGLLRIYAFVRDNQGNSSAKSATVLLE